MITKFLRKSICTFQYITVPLVLVFTVTNLSAQTVGLKYGPRAFSLAPEGTNNLAFAVDQSNMNIGVDGLPIPLGVNTRARSSTLVYTKYVSVAGKNAQLQLAVPFVSVKTDLLIGGESRTLFSESGLTDPYMHLAVSLIGGESMKAREFMGTEPGFTMNLLTAMRVPMGKYDSDKPLNVASNRYEFRLGLPMNYTKGTPGKQRTFEVLPVVSFFGDNDDPYGASHSETDPLYQIEAHYTHDFSPKFYGALSAAYFTGGAVTNTGADNADKVEYSSIGFTLGGRLSRKVGYSFTASRPLDTSSDLNDGNFVRLALDYTF